MKKRAYIVMALLINIALITQFVPGRARQKSTQSEPSALIAPATSKTERLSLPAGGTQMTEGLLNANVMFIENVGQFRDGARFQVRGGDNTIWLAEDAIWVTVLEPSVVSTPDEFPDREPQSENQPRSGVNIRLSFMDANPNPLIEPINRLETKVSYFIGSNPDQWRPDVPVWSGVRYVDLYPGIDLEIAGENGRMSPRLLTHPGADLSAVRMRVEGTEALTLDGNTLRVNTSIGEFTLPLLVVEGLSLEGSDTSAALSTGLEQTTMKRINTQTPVLSGANVFDVFAPFATPNQQSKIENPKSPIDNPDDLLYGTFLGGDNWESGFGIAVDGSGAAYVTGGTESSDFPTTPGAFDTTFSNDDAFVVKLNPAGSGLDYATFLGGSDFDEGDGITVDGSGAAYVTGHTYSTDFPTTPGAFETTFNGGDYDAFMVKVNPAGNDLDYSTFLGGGDDDLGWSVSVDGSRAAYVTGRTYSTDFPTTPGAFDTSHNGSNDVFVVKLTPAGSGLDYGTFLGGDDWDGVTGIAVDGSGSANVTGTTRSSDFPTTPGAFDTSYNGSNDVFVVKVNPAGSGLDYSTFLGRDDTDIGNGIALDGSGAAYVTGWTRSTDFPTTPGAFDTTFNGEYDAFVVKVSPTGSGLDYSTFLGGGDGDIGNGIAVDGSGAAYATGYTVSTDFPTTPDAFDTTYNGDYDAFVVKVNPAGSGLDYGTFLGGGRSDYSYGIALDGSGAAYVMGGTYSTDFPTTPGAFDTSYHSSMDAFVVKVAIACDPGASVCISHIEVTQAIQDSSNNVPLIAEKPTFVRVYVDCGEVCDEFPEVSGGLEISGPAGEVSLSPSPKTISAYHPDSWIDQRRYLNKTLNFMLPTNLVSGTVIFTATVANVRQSETFIFNSVPPLRIGYLSIIYDGAAPDAGRIANAQFNMESLYPLSKVDYFQVPVSIPYIEGRWSWAIKSYLNEIYTWYDLFGWPQPNGEPDQLFGWVPHDNWGLDGSSDPEWGGGAGLVSYGSDTSTNNVYATIMAHEIGHNFGRRHPFSEHYPPQPPPDICDLGDPNWPHDDNSDENYDYAIHDVGFDFGVYSPNTLVSEYTDDLMIGGHCGADVFDDKWISGYTFQALNETLSNKSLAMRQHMSHSVETMTADQPILLVSGRVYTDTTAELDTTYQLTANHAISQAVGTDYCLNLEDGGGGNLSSSCFDLSFIDPEWGFTQTAASFVHVLPYDPAAARLVLVKEVEELAEQLISDNPPTVTLQTPNGGEVISGWVDVTWIAGDADSDPLSYVVSFSADSGQTWYHLGIGITDTHLLVDTNILQGSDQALFRVTASDGINTAYDVSDGVFTLLSHAPEAYILSPNDGSNYVFGQLLLLRGSGYDLEDGSLENGNLYWTSSQDGNLGVGSTLLTLLSPGQHVITLTVTDSLSNTSTDSVNVFSLVPPSDVSIIGPTTGTIGGTFTFTATVDPITATLPITYIWNAAGQSLLTNTSGISDTITYTWNVTGTHVITITATNVGGVVTSTHAITIVEQIPPTPTPTPTPTGTSSPTSTSSPTNTSTNTPTPSPSSTPTSTPTPSPTPTHIPTDTSTPTSTETPTPTLTPSLTATPTSKYQNVFLPLVVRNNHGIQNHQMVIAHRSVLLRRMHVRWR